MKVIKCDVEVAGVLVEQLDCYEVGNTVIPTGYTLEIALQKAIKINFDIDCSVTYDMGSLCVICKANEVLCESVFQFIHDHSSRGMIGMTIENNFSYLCLDVIDVITHEQALAITGSEAPHSPK